MITNAYIKPTTVAVFLVKKMKLLPVLLSCVALWGCFFTIKAMECYNCTGTEDCNKDSVFDDTVTCEGICMWGKMYTPNQPDYLGERFMACYEGTQDEADKYCYNLQKFRQGFCNTCDYEDLCNYH